MDLNQWMVLLMFITFIVMLFRGIPVVYALIGVSLIFILIGEVVLDPSKTLINEYIDFKRTGITYIKLFANGGRFFGGIIKNPVLVALPMFIFMGLMLDQSGVATKMMKSMQVLFGALKRRVGTNRYGNRYHSCGLNRCNRCVGCIAWCDGYSNHDEPRIFKAYSNRNNRSFRNARYSYPTVNYACYHVRPAGNQPW